MTKVVYNSLIQGHNADLLSAKSSEGLKVSMGDLAERASLGSIKREAKAMKRVSDLKHCEALDVAAKKAGFSNYKHAYKVLGSAGVAKS